jgi:hypothetical protein
MFIFGIKDPTETTKISQPETPVPEISTSPDVKSNWGDPPADVDVPAWQLVKIDPNGIRVTWQEKYDGEKSENCIGLWSNATQYMLTWKDSKKIILQKENTDDIKAESITSTQK